MDRATGAMVLMREWRTDEQTRSDDVHERGMRLESWFVATLILVAIFAALLG